MFIEWTRITFDEGSIFYLCCIFVNCFWFLFCFMAIMGLYLVHKTQKKQLVSESMRGSQHFLLFFVASALELIRESHTSLCKSRYIFVLDIHAHAQGPITRDVGTHYISLHTVPPSLKSLKRKNSWPKS